ncbi:hypothetical protein FOXB_11325 [Fusarium oxysporum f. sp. conglutinans Fo5176]|uniref:HNH nuclease domain-containing protein n=3 Tax=Fusarium oxysporum f. sp. conglutinans TaxID=100902 RepID=F9FY43_FUSOF|nr:hypothetical protein FOXB_11325 [Fusarium oxysporum f. sp. conglutinans Fo5176]
MGLLASNNHQLHLSHLEHRVSMPRSLSAVSSLEIRDLNRDQIRFYHPGYLKPLNLLFCLPRVDFNTTEGAFGVHYLTALTACQIVANNAFEKGYLARDERGKDRVSDDETILLQRDYWFFVEGDDRYAIVPSFRDWQFPHDRLPEWWSVPSSRTSLYAKRCAVTNTSYAFTWAHLIPREEQSWFSKNGMGLYGGGSHTIDDPHNILPLKADLYVCFDQSVFALIPKQIGQANGVEASSQYVLHVLDGREAEFTALYQNRPVETLVEGSREYLFARFAWSIFSFLKPFLTSGVGRRVVRFRLRASDDDAEEEHLISEMQNVFLDSRKLESLYGGGHRRKTVSLEDSYVDVEDEWDDEHPGRTEMEGPTDPVTAESNPLTPGSEATQQRASTPPPTGDPISQQVKTDGPTSAIVVNESSSSVPNSDQISLRTKPFGAQLDLWQEAYNAVEENTQKWIDENVGVWPDNTNPFPEPVDLVRSSEEKHDEKAWQFGHGGRPILLRDYTNNVSSCLTAIGDIAINFAPAPFPTVWNASIITRWLANGDLENVSQCEDLASIKGCTDMVLCLVRRGTIYEEVYLHDRPLSPIQDDLKTKLVKQGNLKRFLEALLDPGHGEKRVSDVKELEQDLENTARACDTVVNLARSKKHRELMRSLRLPLSRIDNAVTTVLAKLDEAERIRVMEYTSTIQVGSHHNEKCKSRTEGTCECLFSLPHIASLIIWCFEQRNL